MSQKTILLVDDSKTLLLMEQMILKQGPYRLVTASDGVEAIEKARQEQPQLILLDLMMPELDGLETCKRLKSDDSTRQIPVIVVTTRGESGKKEQAFASGCDDFLTKPIGAHTLLEKVRQYLGE
jgi:CheY-like chemotaxis protein